MKRVLISLLLPIVRRFIVRLGKEAGQNLWDAMWEELFLAIEEAQRSWESSGHGKQKRSWVIEEVVSYLDRRARLNWWQRKIFRIFLGQVIDAIIKTTSDQLGPNWVSRAENLKVSLAGKLSFID